MELCRAVVLGMGAWDGGDGDGIGSERTTAWNRSCHGRHDVGGRPTEFCSACRTAMRAAGEMNESHVRGYEVALL